MLNDGGDNFRLLLPLLSSSSLPLAFFSSVSLRAIFLSFDFLLLLLLLLPVPQIFRKSWEMTHRDGGGREGGRKGGREGLDESLNLARGTLEPLARLLVVKQMPHELRDDTGRAEMGGQAVPKDSQAPEGRKEGGGIVCE